MKRSHLKQLIREVIVEASSPTSVIRWTDGVSVDVDGAGNPVGYKALGYTNSGITIPKSDDWRRFYDNPRGHEKFLSPKLKQWYEVDSSG